MSREVFDASLFGTPDGTVKLTEPRARGDEFWSGWASGDGACVGDLVPDSKAAVTRSGGLQPLQILDKGCERGSRLDREPTGTIAPAGLT
jgi:hypothetical protein